MPYRVLVFVVTYSTVSELCTDDNLTQRNALESSGWDVRDLALGNIP